MTVTLLNTMQSVDEQSFYFVAGEAIDPGNLVSLSGDDGKVYLLNNAAADGCAVTGYSADAAVTTGALVKIIVNPIVELPVASGVTVRAGKYGYVNDSGEVTLSASDHECGRIVCTKKLWQSLRQGTIPLIIYKTYKEIIKWELLNYLLIHVLIHSRILSPLRGWISFLPMLLL